MRVVVSHVEDCRIGCQVTDPCLGCCQGVCIHLPVPRLSLCQIPLLQLGHRSIMTMSLELHQCTAGISSRNTGRLY